MKIPHYMHLQQNQLGRKTKFHNILQDRKIQNVDPFYEELIDKAIKIFSKKVETILENRDTEWEKRLINKQFEENFSKNTYDNQLLKAELQKFVETEEGRKLFQRLLTLEKSNAELMEQYMKSKSILETLRLNYFREINNLREMNQPWRSAQTINDYLQVRFFNATEGFDPNTIEILNSKLEEMKQEYNKRLSILSDDLNDKNLKIQAYQELTPESYGLIEMSLQQILEGIRAIEKDPGKLWKALTKTFTRKFFDSIIEDEYKDYLNEISTREMIRCINKIKKESADHINEVRISMEAEKKSLRYQINMKIEENQYLRQTNINMVNKARRDAVIAAEEKFKEQEKQTLRKFQEEKTRSYWWTYDIKDV